MSLAARIQSAGFDSDDDNDEPRRRLLDYVPSPGAVAMRLRVYATLCGTDIKARKGTFCLGLSACTLVVLVTVLLLTTIANMPIVFLRLGENSEGQMDLVLAPGGEVSAASSLNYSAIAADPRFATGDLSYHTGRLLFGQLDAFNPTRCRNGTAPVSRAGLWQGPDCRNDTACAVAYCGLGTPIELIAMDTAREDRMELGRGWDHPAPGPGEVILSSDVAAAAGVRAGDKLIVGGSVGKPLLQAFLDAELTTASVAPFTTWHRALVELTVARVVSGSDGKLGSGDDVFGFIAVDSALSVVAAGLDPETPSAGRAAFAATDVWTAASTVVFNFPPSRRLDIYADSDAEAVRAAAAEWATPIIAALGFNQLEATVPIVSSINERRFFALFLGLVLSMIIAGLGFLCIVLVHSLLTVGVETRTFELAVMRMVGMTQPQLAGYVVMGAAFFAVPAWVLGLVLGQAMFLGIRTLLGGALGVSFPWPLSGQAVLFGTLAGFGLPGVSSIAPIISVLALDLPQALDTTRSRVNLVIYSIERAGDFTVNWALFLFGATMTVLGFLLYYLFPLALVQTNIALLLYIFFGILLGMLFGLVLLSVNFERVVESAVAYVFLWWENDAVFSLVTKNLVAHRQRNRKTTLMFAMSIGFLIFISVMFGLEIKSATYSQERLVGAFMRAKPDFLPNMILVRRVDQKLRDLEATGRVPGLRWAWATANPRSTVLGPANFSAMTIGRFVRVDGALHAVSPNFWDVLKDRFLTVRDEARSRFPLAESLYTSEGSARFVVSTGALLDMTRNAIGDDFQTVIERTAPDGRNVEMRQAATSQALLDTSPGLVATKFPNGGRQPFVACPATVLARSNHSFRAFRDLYFDAIYVAVDDESADTKTIVEETMRSAGGAMGYTNVLDVRDDLSVAADALNFFFLFTQIMAGFVCLFALSSSMATNIHEQTKEIGMLRAIGLSKGRCWRIYVEEAFVLVFAASLMGTGVGLVMGYTITLQRILFTQLPLAFVFPWLQLAVAFLSSIAFAFISSFGPITSLLASKSVTHILRRTV